MGPKDAKNRAMRTFILSTVIKAGRLPKLAYPNQKMRDAPLSYRSASDRQP